MGKHFDLNHPVWTPVLNERGRRVVVHIFRSKNLVEVTSAAITNQRAKSWCGKVLVGGMYITRSPKSLSKSLTFDIERSVAGRHAQPLLVVHHHCPMPVDLVHSAPTYSIYLPAMLHYSVCNAVLLRPTICATPPTTMLLLLPLKRCPNNMRCPRQQLHRLFVT